jgi:hypothetical protein
VIVLYRPPDTGLHEFVPILNKIDAVLKSLPSPAPTITLMGDMNFPASVITWQVIEGLIVPRVAGHRLPDHDSEGGKVRQQAAKLCDIAVKYHLSKQVGVPTRDKEVLGLIWSLNPDLVSNIQVDTFKDFTDHSVVTAATSFKLEEEVIKEEQFLLDGRRLRKLDFHKAPWPEVKTRLRQLDWEPLENMAKENVIAAHHLFMETILPIL